VSKNPDFSLAVIVDGLARTAHSLAGRADRVLRNPRARRGVDLPVPRHRPRPGLSPNMVPCNLYHPVTRPSSQTSVGHPPCRNPAPPRSASGPAASVCPRPTDADSDQKSGKGGATHTHQFQCATQIRLTDRPEEN